MKRVRRGERYQGAHVRLGWLCLGKGISVTLYQSENAPKWKKGAFFHPFVTNPLEITFSLAKWDHRQVESENPLTLQLSPSLKCDTIPLTTLSLASITLCCLSCSFWIVLSPTFTGTFFFLLLTWRHCLGSLLHPLLILNNLYAISV